MGVGKQFVNKGKANGNLLFPEAEVLHYLDILDARMFDMQAALDATEPGGFSDKIWTLDNRRLYKPMDTKEEADD